MPPDDPGPSSPLSISRQSLERQIADMIRQRILDGKWPDGERLVETRLAELFGVSRGPVRGALKELTAEGIVEISPRRGTFVRWMPGEDLSDLVLVREINESTALRLAIQHHFDELVGDLAASVSDMDRLSSENDRDGVLGAELSFHEAIYARSGSRRLSQIWALMSPAIYSSLCNDRAYYTDPTEIVASHDRLCRVVSLGTEEAAVSELYEHIRPSGVRVAPTTVSDGR